MNIAEMQQITTNVFMRPATITEATKRRKKLRVAAYCRVSTDEDDQLLSYEVQIKHYTSVIEKNPEWINAGIFADEGLSGVRTKKRDEFNRMIELCRAGKIDKILTKSVSRFARNTLDSLQYIRELKALGISIYFEKENVDTLTAENETIITFFSAFAQSESESISGNIRLGKRYKFKAGEAPMMFGNILGYKKGEDGKPEIIPEEAKIIRFIYDSYLEGKSYSGIAEMLREKGWKTKKGRTDWGPQAVSKILKNEKYKGDVVLQKTFVSDLFTKTVKKNRGELPMYYVKNHHIPIIEPAVFDRVQVEIARRGSLRAVSDKTMTQNAKYSSKYALTGLVECGDCGCKYRRTTWSKRGIKKVVWRCISRLDHGTKYCTKSPSIPEESLQDGIMKIINSMLDGKEEMKRILYGSIAEVLNAPDSEMEIIKLNKQIEELNQEIIAIVTNGVETRKSREEIEEECKQKYKEVSGLQEKLNSLKAKQQIEKAQAGAAKTVYEMIENMPFEYEAYDDSAVRKMVSKVKILSADEIEVTLMNTVVLTVNI